jgi:hypothetical protein
MRAIIPKFKKRDGRHYNFTKVAAFLLLIISTDFFVGKIFHRLYKKQKSGWEYRTRYSVEDTKADIILLGASRAQQQYNPVFFEQRLHLSCYNVGRDGQSFLYEYVIMQGILKRYHPKVILLECERRMFMESSASNERLSCLLPLYKDHPEMREVLLLKSPFENIKLLSQSYPYNSFSLKILFANFTKKPDEDIKGYVPLKGSLNEPKRFVDFSLPQYQVDSIKVKYFNSFIDQCRKANIKLYFTCSPFYFTYTGKDISLEIAKETAGKNNIPFFDLSKGVPELNDSKFYDDTVHVNQTGSNILTNIIIDSIINSER